MCSPCILARLRVLVDDGFRERLAHDLLNGGNEAEVGNGGGGSRSSRVACRQSAFARVYRPRSSALRCAVAASDRVRPTLLPPSRARNLETSPQLSPSTAPPARLVRVVSTLLAEAVYT